MEHEYITTTYECTSYKDVLIIEKHSDYFIKLRKDLDTKEWTIIDFNVNESTSGDLLTRAKMHSKNICVNLNEKSVQTLINFFKQNKIRVKLQINFD
jgi:hypothetical protein